MPMTRKRFNEVHHLLDGLERIDKFLAGYSKLEEAHVVSIGARNLATIPGLHHATDAQEFGEVVLRAAKDSLRRKRAELVSKIGDDVEVPSPAPGQEHL